MSTTNEEIKEFYRSTQRLTKCSNIGIWIYVNCELVESSNDINVIDGYDSRHIADVDARLGIGENNKVIKIYYFKNNESND